MTWSVYKDASVSTNYIKNNNQCVTMSLHHIMLLLVFFSFRVCLMAFLTKLVLIRRKSCTNHDYFFYFLLCLLLVLFADNQFVIFGQRSHKDKMFFPLFLLSLPENSVETRRMAGFAELCVSLSLPFWKRTVSRKRTCL